MLPAVQVGTLVLCAGFGSRLGELTRWRPKALVPVGDRPALAHVVDRVRAVSRVVVVNSFHLGSALEAYAREAGLVVSREDELLGTGGAIAHAAGALGAGDVLVWNGDMMGDLDAAALLAAHARAGGVATLALAPSVGDRRGNVGLDADGHVVRIRNEVCRPGEASSGSFLGIYVVGDAIRRALPDSVAGIIEDGLLPAIRGGARVATFACEAPFTDIGTPAEYLRANLEWLAARGACEWRGAGAVVGEGVVLDAALIGEGARVEGVGRVERCVVWPGAVARAPIAGAVVAPEGVVVI
jgi:mannose-1-phosphate guanylyltransferase